MISLIKTQVPQSLKNLWKKVNLSLLDVQQKQMWKMLELDILQGNLPKKELRHMCQLMIDIILEKIWQGLIISG